MTGKILAAGSLRPQLRCRVCNRKYWDSPATPDRPVNADGVCSVCEFTQDAGKPAITLAEIDALVLADGLCEGSGS